jgi:hypothetical protein
MEMPMKDIGIKDKDMERHYIYGIMEINSTDNGKMIK